MKPTVSFEKQICGKIVEIDLYGKIGCAEHERIIPEIRRMIREQGTVRFLVRMHNFTAWNVAALWDELEWNAKELTPIERLAIVGEEALQKWMTAFCDSFTTGKVRFFPSEQLEGAREWLKE